MTRKESVSVRIVAVADSADVFGDTTHLVTHTWTHLVLDTHISEVHGHLFPTFWNENPNWQSAKPRKTVQANVHGSVQETIDQGDILCTSTQCTRWIGACQRCENCWGRTCCRVRYGNEQGFFRGKTMGDEQFKAGNIIGKRTHWRISSSTQQGMCSLRLVEGSVESIWDAGGRRRTVGLRQSEFRWTDSRVSRVGFTSMARGRSRSGRKFVWPNRVGVGAQVLWLRSPEWMCGARQGRPYSLKCVLKKEEERSELDWSWERS